MAKEPENRPIRVIHLEGGLRAYDIQGRENLKVGHDGVFFGEFKNPPYHSVYGTLELAGLKTIGVEFIENRDQINGVEPVEFYSFQNGFRAINQKRQWDFVRHKCTREGNFGTASISARIGSYLSLLNWRILKISDAYYKYSSRTFLKFKGGESLPKFGSSNTWNSELSSTIHGFVSDAATLRDILAEAIWNLLLHNTDKSVLTMGSLLKKAKNSQDPIVRKVLDSARSGWLKNLTDIRNEVVHVVPVSQFHEQDAAHYKRIIFKNVEFPRMHYPLTTDDWRLRKGHSRVLDVRDEGKLISSLDNYREFVSVSGDALEYCHNVFFWMSDLCDTIRKAANLSAPIPVIRDKDLA